MVYVALLRGINIGGRNKVEMPRLKLSFELAGCTDVVTYINSGNVIFRHNKDADALVPVIETAILNEFGLEIPVVLRDQDAMSRLSREIPADWTNDIRQKTDVLFLWDEINEPGVTDKVAINPAIENVLHLGGALVWNIGRENITRGSGIKLIKTDLYKYMTVRNINTVRKLTSMMETLSARE